MDAGEGEPLALFLRDAGLAGDAELEAARELARDQGDRTLGEALVRLGVLSAEALDAACLLTVLRTMKRRGVPWPVSAPPPPSCSLDSESEHFARARFGDYQMVEELGRGAFGLVYRALRLSDAREVAIKVMPSSVAQGGHKETERFEREAEVLRKLDHKNVVRVIDSGVHEGTHFLVMSYIRGRSLRDLLEEKRRLDPPSAVRLHYQAAEGLHHIHQAGLLHRDVKPANLMVTEDETAVIVDFGLAWARTQHALTTTGALVGTPMYMAPERLMGLRDALGPPCDLYSLGAMLFESLAGVAPFEGGDNYEIIRQALYEAPRDLRDYYPDAPDRIIAVLARAMARDPRQRYQSARVLAQDLQKFSLELKIDHLSGLNRRTRRR